MKNTSMNFAVFTAAIVKKIQEKAGSGFRILSGTVKKNNGIELTGIIIEEKGCNTSPTIYIDDFFSEYRNGLGIGEIAETIWQIYRKNRFEESVDLSNFTDYQKAKRQIAFRLVNYEKNKELLVDVPFKRFLDLAVIFYYSVQEPPFYGKASILICREHMEKWDISLEELYQNARSNTQVLFPAKIENIENVMVEMLEKGRADKASWVEAGGLGPDGQEWMDELLSQLQRDFEREENKIPMYVLSNTQKLYGAACILYVNILEKFSRLINSDFYILPSSVHEVILLPVSEHSSTPALLDMVTEINKTQVEESEILADSVYYFAREDNSVRQLG